MAFALSGGDNLGEDDVALSSARNGSFRAGRPVRSRRARKRSSKALRKLG